jgi:hypothetical protein
MCIADPDGAVIWQCVSMMYSLEEAKKEDVVGMGGSPYASLSLSNAWLWWE